MKETGTMIEAERGGYFDDPEYPDPTPSDLESPEFNAVWGAIKGWDVSRYPGEKGLYSGATGNDVMRILNALRGRAT